MKVQITKWGNSLGVRLPKAVAEELALKPGQTLDLTVENGAVELRARPKKPRYKLADLLADMKPEDAPPPIDWGPDRGAEIIDDAYSRGEITLDDILNKDADGSSGGR